MTQALEEHWRNRTVSIDGRAFPVWPDGQQVRRVAAPVILYTRFEDAPLFHDALIDTTLNLERTSRFKVDYKRGACGVKVYHPDRWESPEAELLHLRALAFYSIVFDVPEPVADVGMANIARDGEYCVAHSHIRTEASTVYMLSPGDDTSDDPREGRLCFVDPRLEECCGDEPGRMTNPLVPRMQPGAMLMFPSELVHSVTPYNGTRPRITFAWNIDSRVIPGDAAPGGLPD